MSNTAKSIFTTLVILFSIFILCVILFFYLYIGVVDFPLISESLRVQLDGYFIEKYNKRDLFIRFLHNTVLGNNDKYAWYPPRATPVYSKDSGIFSGYEVYGMVASWEPSEFILRVRSYNRQNLVIRFNPGLDGSIAVISPVDQYGNIPSVNSIRIVNSTTDTYWLKLFCPSDIVAIMVGSKAGLSVSTVNSPIIPKHVRLVRRLCGT